MIQINNLSIARGSKPILTNSELTLFPGEKVGLIGHNGAGKSSFLSALLGELPIDQGSIDLPKVWRLSWIDQEVTANHLTVIDFALEGDRALHDIRQKIHAVEESGDMEQLGHLYEELENLDGYTAEARVATILNGLGFKTEDLQRKVGEFSGGWKMRLNLAKVLGSRADLILLDEPTNHLDIATRQALASSLLEFEGALVMVSHDRHLLESITDRFWRVHQGAVTEFDGDLDDYAELLRKETSAENQKNKQNGGKAAPAKVEQAAPPVDRQQVSQRLKQLNNQVKKLEKQIEVDRPKLIGLDASLAGCDYSNPDSAKKAASQHEERNAIAARLELAENELLNAMVEIESLEEALGV